MLTAPSALHTPLLAHDSQPALRLSPPAAGTASSPASDTIASVGVASDPLIECQPRTIDTQSDLDETPCRNITEFMHVRGVYHSLQYAKFAMCDGEQAAVHRIIENVLRALSDGALSNRNAKVLPAKLLRDRERGSDQRAQVYALEKSVESIAADPKNRAELFPLNPLDTLEAFVEKSELRGFDKINNLVARPDEEELIDNTAVDTETFAVACSIVGAAAGGPMAAMLLGGLGSTASIVAHWSYEALMVNSAYGREHFASIDAPSFELQPLQRNTPIHTDSGRHGVCELNSTTNCG